MKAKKKDIKLQETTNNGKTAPGKPDAATKTTVKKIHEKKWQQNY